jgi:hypothetical protein
MKLNRHLETLNKTDIKIKGASLSLLNMDDLTYLAEKRGISTAGIKQTAKHSGILPPTRDQIEKLLNTWALTNSDRKIPKPLVLFSRVYQHHHLDDHLKQSNK